MKKKKSILALLLTTALSLSLVACGSSSGAGTTEPADASAAAASAPASDAFFRTLDEIRESGSVNIGVFSDKNPFGYVDENGEYQGYDVYFANRIGEDLGVDVNYVSTEAANRVEYLETVTEERAEKVYFALPYMNVALGVVSPDSRVIKDLSELEANDEVIVISGTTAETYLQENNPEIKLQKSSFGHTFFWETLR